METCVYKNKEPYLKMLNEDTILELDYSSQKKRKKQLISLAFNFSLLIFFALLSSYKNPNIRIHNKLVDTISFQFSYLLENQIRSIKDTYIYDTVNDINSKLNGLIVQFYESREYKPVWLNNYSVNPQFLTFTQLIDSSAYFGFPYDYFNSETIHFLYSDLGNKESSKNLLDRKVELEITTTLAALKFMLYLKHGILEQDASSDYQINLDTIPQILNKAFISNDLRNGILSVQPQLVEHQNLLQCLSNFIDLNYSVKYTTPAFIDDKLLAKSLYYSGVSKYPVFDLNNQKSEVLYKLESEYNLPKDSLFNILTHEILVSMLEFRYLQICLNLNRLRSMQQSGENYLFVNIPEYKLYVVEANKSKESFNVIVGKKDTPTPVLSSSIEKVVANPYWTVPRSIVNNEMLSKIRKDSTYLKRNGFFVIDNYEKVINDSIIDWNTGDPLGNKYWLRQINSRYNALGQVKFIFPNEFSVYLHDTPSKKLFENKTRLYSHGCIRLENPDKLAQYLTHSNNIENENDFGKLLKKTDRQVIGLSRKMQIHIQYITCTGADNSDMVFFNDIYNLDKEEIKVTFPSLSEI